MHDRGNMNSGSMHAAPYKGPLYDKDSTYDSSTGYVQNQTGLNISDQAATAALTGKPVQSDPSPASTDVSFTS